VQAYIVSAFTAKGKGGNLAGVVLQAQNLSSKEMQQIASTLNLSETAFISQLSASSHSIQFFTPTSEVALCGHATIASYSVLAEKNQILPGVFTMETKAGTQQVQYQEDGLIRMSQNLPEFGRTLPPEHIANCLGISPEDISNAHNIPPIIASTGLHKIFVPVTSLTRLNAIQPDILAIEEYSKVNGAIGMYCYSLESLGKATAHCRNFAPVVGILEDSATGTSAAALSCVLHKYGVLPVLHSHQLHFEQGYCIDQPAELIVFLEASPTVIKSVQVAGRANLIKMIPLPHLEE
jgi:PhzF family phenazine biosynthesis protein